MDDNQFKKLEAFIDGKLSDQTEHFNRRFDEINESFDKVFLRLGRVEDEIVSGNERFKRLESQDERLIDHLVEKHGADRAALTASD